MIREADVWANMARNLARALEKENALAFLERARDVRQGAVQALQAGLQPGEQRQAEGLQRTTLRQSLRRETVAEHVAEVARELGDQVPQQSKMIEQLQTLVPVLRERVERTLSAAKPLLRQMAERVRERQQQARERRELEAIRKDLLRERMAGWRRAQKQSGAAVETEKGAEIRLRRDITAMPDVELRHVVAERQRQEAARQKQQERAARMDRSRGPSLGL